jgi:biopolymer transport protein ExbB
MTMDTVEVLKNLLVQTGAAWVLWLLLLLSAASLAIAAERFLHFRARSDDLRGLAAMLDAHLRAGSRQEAISALAAMRSAGAAVALAGLRLADRGPAAAEKAMASAMAIERKSLEARLAFLGTLGNNAPFIGLFGTVLGIIKAFHDLKENPQGGLDVVGGGVSEALVATAVGIMVAIPAVVAFNVFNRRVRAATTSTDEVAHVVLAELHGSEKEAA